MLTLAKTMEKPQGSIILSTAQDSCRGMLLSKRASTAENKEHLSVTAAAFIVHHSITFFLYNHKCSSFE